MKQDFILTLSCEEKPGLVVTQANAVSALPALVATSILTIDATLYHIL